MEFTETSSQGWFSRLGGAFKGIITGIILFLVSFPMLWMNEGCAVDQYKKIGAAEKAVVEVPAEKVDKGNDGKLIHISGEAKTEDLLQDLEFGVQKKAIKLRRDVEMYQVHENVETKKKKKTGGSEETTKTYSYELRWSSSPVDSSGFKRKYFDQTGHAENPPFPFEGLTQKARTVNVGAFKLSTGLIDSYTKFEKLPVGDAKPTKANVKKSGDGFYVGGNPASPAIGDVRVSYHVALPGPASIMAQQNGTELGPWQSPNGKVEWLVEKKSTAAEMIQAQRDAVAVMTWILRFVGFLMMFIGLMLIFKPLSVMGDVIPFIGSIIGAASGFVAFLIAASLSSLVIAIAWVAHRPLVGIPLLLVTVAGIGGIIFLKMKNRKAA
jgi:hypothetical protein